MQANQDRTKSTDLARRLENVVARLGDANQVINNHQREIEELNVLVEDLKHTIDLKNAELAQLQARTLGAMSAQDRVDKQVESATESSAIESEELPTQAINDEVHHQQEVLDKVPVVNNGPNRTVLATFLGLLAALFSVLTFARLRKPAADNALLDEGETASNTIAADSLANLLSEDVELRQQFSSRNGSTIAEAEVLAAYGHHDVAIVHLQQALHEKPESSDIINALRETYILSGRYEQAAELYPELESANDNAVIDTAYLQDSLVIDDVEEPFDDSKPVALPLAAGSFSLHHGLCPHRSAPNTTNYRRIGLGLNFIPPHVHPSGSVRHAAMLVRGRDRYGHFELVEPPSAELDDEAIATHARAMALYRDAYIEEEARHARLSS